MEKNLKFLFLIVCLLSFSQDAWPQESPEKAGQAASEAWLGLVDSGKYAETWDTAAAYFRNALKKEDWQRSLTAVRKPLGKVLSRKLRSAMFTRSLPGAPDGEYVVILYDTVFENKKSAVETITAMRDKDGKWRVAGYYIA